MDEWCDSRTEKAPAGGFLGTDTVSARSVDCYVGPLPAAISSPGTTIGLTSMPLVWMCEIAAVLIALVLPAGESLPLAQLQGDSITACLDVKRSILDRQIRELRPRV